MSGRINLWLLASAGVLIGHVLGYAAAHPSAADRAVALGGHAHLGPLGLVLVPAGLLGALGMAVRAVRRSHDATPSLPALAALQLVLFAALEVLERIPGPGVPLDAVAERGVWLGALAQVLVAWVALRLVDLTARVLRAVVAGTRPRLGVLPVLRSAPAEIDAAVEAVLGRLPARRGPPQATGPLAST